MAAEGWRILVQNGIVQAQDPGQAATLLRSKPHGAYTTTKTVNGALILWERHLQRLSQSIRMLTRNATLDSTMVGNLVDPSVYVGMEKAMSMKNEDEECVVTILACTSDSQFVEPCDVYVHIASIIPAPVFPAKLAVMGPGRQNPLIKSSSWASARQVLEKCKPQGTSEVILSNNGQHLLEGLMTNFFVVIASDDEQSGFYVQTAALEDGVLPGVIRHLIIEICKELNIRVFEAAPSWHEQSLWTEAFITSSVRLIQSVEAIQMPVPWNTSFDCTQWNRLHWDHISLQIPGPVTEMLQKMVHERVKCESATFTTS